MVLIFVLNLKTFQLKIVNLVVNVETDFTETLSMVNIGHRCKTHFIDSR